MERLTDILKTEDCSLVIANNGQTYRLWQRGVADLYKLLTDEPDVLRGARMADKVVGKGAAALAILGKVREIYALVISSQALELLSGTDITVHYDKCVDHIINRAGTGWCPVERLCHDVNTADECLVLIEKFIKENNK